MLVFVCDVVFAAVQHAVKIERLLACQQRDNDIQRRADEHREEVELVCVYRAFDGIHLPVNPRIERTRHFLEEIAYALHPSMPLQERIDGIRPVALRQNREQRQHHARAKRRPRARACSETAVEAENHDRAAAAHPE